MDLNKLHQGFVLIHKLTCCALKHYVWDFSLLWQHNMGWSSTLVIWQTPSSNHHCHLRIAVLQLTMHTNLGTLSNLACVLTPSSMWFSSYATFKATQRQENALWAGEQHTTVQDRIQGHHPWMQPLSRQAQQTNGANLLSSWKIYITTINNQPVFSLGCIDKLVHFYQNNDNSPTTLN